MNSLMHFLCQNAKNEMDLMFFFVVVIFSVSHLLLKFYFTLIHFINICISLISIDSLMLDCCIVLVYLMDFVLVVTLYLWNENKYTSTDQVLSIFDPFMLLWNWIDEKMKRNMTTFVLNAIRFKLHLFQLFYFDPH